MPRFNPNLYRGQCCCPILDRDSPGRLAVPITAIFFPNPTVESRSPMSLYHLPS